MAGNHYDFQSRWRVEGTCAEIYEVLMDEQGVTRWWPSVYLEVEKVKAGDANGLGKQVALFTKGWLPYSLRWRFEIIETNPPAGFTLRAHGDFEGIGIWAFTPDGTFVDILYDWRIEAEKPALKLLSPVLKPLFAANHRWAMARGEESLRLELARRHATSDAERVAVPPPPGPTFR